MKKLILLSAVLLGTVAASHAGVDVHVGFNLPFPGIVIGRPAPPVVYQPAPVVVAPPVYCPPPVVMAPPPCVPAPVIVAPAPAPVVVLPAPRYPRNAVVYNGRVYRGHQWEYVHHHR